MKNDIQQAKSVGLESPTESELRSPDHREMDQFRFRVNWLPTPPQSQH